MAVVDLYTYAVLLPNGWQPGVLRTLILSTFDWTDKAVAASVRPFVASGENRALAMVQTEMRSKPDGSQRLWVQARNSGQVPTFIHYWSVGVIGP